MDAVCPVCGKADCKPREKNSIGVEVQEFNQENGWVGVGLIHDTYCLAGKQMGQMPKNGTVRRTYSALAPRQ